MLGYGVHIYWRDLSRTLPALLAATLVLFTARALEVFDVITLPSLASDGLGIVLAFVAISTLLGVRRRLSWAPLARLGYFSFAIYLLHVFGTAPARMVLGRVGVDSEIIVFGMCLVAGLALPIVFEVTLGRVRWISWTFLGQKPYQALLASSVQRRSVSQ